MQFLLQICGKPKPNLFIFDSHSRADSKSWTAKDQIEMLDKTQFCMLNMVKHGLTQETTMVTPNTNKRARDSSLIRKNIGLARVLWQDKLTPLCISELKKLSDDSGLSIASGDVLLLDRKWYVTHAGLLRIALRRRCLGIRTTLQTQFCDPIACRWVFKATVYKSPRSRGFVGYGDANPSNVSSLVRGAEMRVAETRAVNRALRKAYGIGLCSVEELGWSPREPEPVVAKRQEPIPSANNGHNNGQPRLRDRLCLLIRQHQLDANLVKAFAADYCGTATLRDAGRDLVENFINDLAERATKDRAALVCHLNTYSKSQEVNS
jgi:hypothetical protein